MYSVARTIFSAFLVAECATYNELKIAYEAHISLYIITVALPLFPPLLCQVIDPLLLIHVVIVIQAFPLRLLYDDELVVILLATDEKIAFDLVKVFLLRQVDSF